MLPENLQPLLEQAYDTLEIEQLKEVEQLLIEYQDIFLDNSGKVTQTNLVQHEIDVGSAKPTKIPARRVPLSNATFFENEIKKMLEQGIIEPSQSAWASPIVLVTKSDKSVRFAIDYRKVNAVTKKDAYSLPQISEALDTLAGAKYFCTFDMASGY